MFGYIVPFVPELKIREFELFRSYYCGLCRTLKDRYGKCDVLNYDAVFLYVLSEGFEEGETTTAESKCVAHPFRTQKTRRGPHADYAADINMLMAYAKARDDRADAGGPGAALQLAALKRRFARAKDVSPAAAAGMEEAAALLENIEKSGTGDVDAAAEPYGKLLGSVFSDVYVLQSHVLYDLGYNLGRWTYLIDAFDDMEQDEKKGLFNVFVNRAKERGLQGEQLRDEARFSLHFTLAQAADALGRLELKKNRELLTNIVRLGLLAQTESVLSGQGRLDESIRNPRRI